MRPLADNDTSPVIGLARPGAGPVTGIDPAGLPNGVVNMIDVLAALAQALAVDCTAP